jgi:DNA-binding GntR family transcriptional regulator
MENEDTTPPAAADERTLVAFVTDELRRDILSGRLAPGSRLAQATVAERLGISRLPVREALRLLEMESLVSMRPNSGATVTPLTIDEMYEVYRMREQLEPMAITESIPRLTDAQVDEIRRLHAVLDATPVGGEQWLEADRGFHLATVAGAPMPRLLRSIAELFNAASRYRRALAKWVPTDLPTVQIEHALLMNAVERRYAEDAAAILEMHIRRTRQSLLVRQDVLIG